MPARPVKDRCSPVSRMSRCYFIDEHLPADAVHARQDQRNKLSVDGNGGIGIGTFLPSQP